MLGAMSRPFAHRSGAAFCGAALLACIAANACAPMEVVELGRGSTSIGDGGDGGDAGATATRVLGFVLVDVPSGNDLRPLVNGDTLDTTLGPFTVRAELDPPQAGSVVFAVDDKPVLSDDAPPWTVTGVDPHTGKLLGWQVSAGSHELRATPNQQAGGKGARGIGLEQTFHFR